MKIPRRSYTVQFKELAVKRVADGEAISVVVKELDLGNQTLRSWIEASTAGKLKGVNSEVITPDEMEASKLRSEVERLKRELEIIKSDSVLRARCPVKYAWIAEHGKQYSLVEICAALSVSISGYRSWGRGGTPNRKRLADVQMVALIRATDGEIKGAYGSPRGDIPVALQCHAT